MTTLTVRHPTQISKSIIKRFSNLKDLPSCWLFALNATIRRYRNSLPGTNALAYLSEQQWRGTQVLKHWHLADCQLLLGVVGGELPHQVVELRHFCLLFFTIVEKLFEILKTLLASRQSLKHNHAKLFSQFRIEFQLVSLHVETQTLAFFRDDDNISFLRQCLFLLINSLTSTSNLKTKLQVINKLSEN